MYKGRKILAVIPARSGSKGLKGKNIKPMNGKPLIWWTIKESKKSGYIDRVIVSTDSREIAEAAEKCGAEAPFLRPKKLSNDTASSADVVIHALDFYAEKGEVFDIFVLLQPTSPLRSCEDIDSSIRLLFRKKAEMIVGVSEVTHPLEWVNTLPASGCMKGFLSSGSSEKGRQFFARNFMPNGAIFTGFTETLRGKKSFYTDGTFAYIMSRERSVDIDDAVDFKLAEALIKDRPGRRL